MNDNKYSVLMSVYYKEKPEYLEESLNSVFDQTIKPDEVVLVKDGPITKELNQVIEDFLKKQNNFHAYCLKKNMGLGNALNFGLKHCNNEIIFRMDTDDIAISTRAELQLDYLRKHPEVDILGSYVSEFVENSDNSNSFVKEVPLSNEEIKKTFKVKNAMNHPSVVYKKSRVLSIGGYTELNLNEDYFLWVRMAEKGFVFSNMDKSLVRMRVSNETYLRRGGFKYFLVQNSIYKYMLKIKYISYFEYVIGYLMRLIFRVFLTNELRKIIYIKLLRKGI